MNKKLIVIDYASKDGGFIGQVNEYQLKKLKEIKNNKDEFIATFLSFITIAMGGKGAEIIRVREIKDGKDELLFFIPIKNKEIENYVKKQFRLLKFWEVED